MRNGDSFVCSFKKCLLLENSTCLLLAVITFIKTMKQGGHNIGLWRQVSSIKFNYTALFHHSIEEIEKYNSTNIYI